MGISPAIDWWGVTSRRHHGGQGACHLPAPCSSRCTRASVCIGQRRKSCEDPGNGERAHCHCTGFLNHIAYNNVDSGADNDSKSIEEQQSEAEASVQAGPLRCVRHLEL